MLPPTGYRTLTLILRETRKEDFTEWLDSQCRKLDADFFWRGGQRDLYIRLEGYEPDEYDYLLDDPDSPYSMTIRIMANQINITEIDVCYKLTDYTAKFILGLIAERWPETREIISAQVKDEKMPDNKKQTKGRERGPSVVTLKNCTEAMRKWLDEEKSLKVAGELSDCDDQTLLRWMEQILDQVDPEKRERWIKLIRAQKKEKYLGKYREDKCQGPRHR